MNETLLRCKTLENKHRQGSKSPHNPEHCRISFFVCVFQRWGCAAAPQRVHSHELVFQTNPIQIRACCFLKVAL